ncbi:M23 family metallopeptidase [Helicobacter sp. 23-1048]
MKNNKRLILMITDQNGTRYVNIHAIFRQLALYALILILVLIIFSITSIQIFKQEIENISTLNETILTQYEDMQSQNAELNAQLQEQVDEISLLDKKLGDLEGTIGVDSKKNTDSLTSRVDIASYTGAQKAFVMKFIPNGYPITNYKIISADYGYRRHPVFFTQHLHTGIDFAADKGTPVYATADGVVESAEMTYGGYGILVKLDHSFGFRTYYAHLEKVVVSRGSFVKKGQVIAYSGSSGISTGPHLHYEIRFLGNVLNPRHFINWNMRNFSSIFEKERSIQWQSLLMTINSLMEQEAETTTEEPLSLRKAQGLRAI